MLSINAPSKRVRRSSTTLTVDCLVWFVSARSKADTTRAQQMLLKDPDGPEFERTIVVQLAFFRNTDYRNLYTTSGWHSRNKDQDFFDLSRRQRPNAPRLVARTGIVCQRRPTRSVINDPVAGFTYTLDHKASSASRNVIAQLPFRSSAPIETASKRASGRNQILPMPSTFETGKTALRTDTTSDVPKTPESLGTREIEGILAEGIRLSFTVPAGTIGMIIPVETAAERWHAPALQTVVLLKRTVSRYRKTTYTLTDINAANQRQPSSLCLPTTGSRTIEKSRTADKLRNFAHGTVAL